MIMVLLFARVVLQKENSEKRNPRGRPRLTEEEKQRRKELRELGLMKRSRRRTKEGMVVYHVTLSLYHVISCDRGGAVACRENSHSCQERS